MSFGNFSCSDLSKRRSLTFMEADCHIFLYKGFVDLIYPVYLFQCHFHFLRNLVKPSQMCYTWYFKFITGICQDVSQGFVDTRVLHSTSPLLLFRNCRDFPDLLWSLPLGEKEVSETRNMKDILETSYRKMLNLVYQNWNSKVIN